MSENNNVNYIKQLNGIYTQLAGEDKLTSAHISLYLALFQLWNLGKFRNPISICRSETMRLARIGSKTTYYKTLKDLNAMGYIEYQASNNPMVGSKIRMIIHQSNDSSALNSTCPSSVPLSGQFPHILDHQESHIRDNSLVNLVPYSGQLEGPSINSINNKPIKHINKEKVKRNFFHSPQLPEVKDFFLEIKSTTDQAEQFFNHFQSNGWLVGGKAKMKDWKAAARNWVKRAQKFRYSSMVEKSKSMSAQERLHTNQDKDYNIPL